MGHAKKADMNLLGLFEGEFLNWSVALISAAIAIAIRPLVRSIVLAIAAGAFLGFVGPKFELLDIYLTPAGWQSIDTLTLTVVALTALASLLWWIIARALYDLVRRGLSAHG